MGLPDKLGRLMLEYSRLVRMYRKRGMIAIPEIARLSERDVAILECVHNKGKATFSEIAWDLYEASIPKTSASTISQAISALYMKEGLVDKKPNPKDQRQPIITLTEKGLKAVEKLEKFRYDYLSRVRESMELTDEESQVLERAFSRGIKNFARFLSDIDDRGGQA